jgi:hypothetical protein
MLAVRMAWYNSNYMTNRETKEITTPAGNKVVLRTYLTGKESNAIKALLYADMKINTSDAASGKIALGDIPASFMIAQEHKALEFIVVSFNGDENSPIAMLEDLPETEYNAVLAEVNKIRSPLVPRS